MLYRINAISNLGNKVPLSRFNEESVEKSNLVGSLWEGLILLREIGRRGGSRNPAEEASAQHRPLIALDKGM